jgi:hypothetical protein
MLESGENLAALAEDNIFFTDMFGKSQLLPTWKICFALG